MTISNIYIDGSEKIYHFRQVEDITRIESFVNQLNKESYQSQAATQSKDNFCVPKTSLQIYLNIISPSLKYSSLKHLWYLMRLGEIRSKTVRKTTTEKIVRFKVGHETQLLKD